MLACLIAPEVFVCGHCSCSWWEPQLYVNKYEAKCSLLIERHLLLFCTLH